MTVREHGTETFLDDLRSELARRIAIVGLGVACLILWQSLVTQPFPATIVALAAAAASLALTALWLGERHSRLARHVLVWGLAAILILAMAALSDASLLAFAVVLVFAAALLASGSGFVIAGSISLVFWMSTSADLHAVRPGALAALATGSVLAWLVVRSLYTAIGWAYTMQRRADDLLELARDRQGELNRTLTSLDRANTLLRRTQAELVAARRQAEEAQLMKQQFAANISHELRTPLNLILGFSELMYLSPDLYGKMTWPPDLRHAVHQIYQSSRHLLGMIDDILDLSRFELAGYTVSREQTPLSNLLQETAAMMKDLFVRGNVRLETDIPPDLPTLKIDRTRIRQVVINLLTNAHRFTAQGTVRLIARCGPADVTISVSDSGPGVPADKLGRIFDEFYQADGSLRRRHSGAGLGLAISKRFVEAHGGRIWAENNSDRGATFHFTLPLAMVDASPARPIPSTDREPASTLVLVVDPDPSVASLVRRHLDQYEVIHIQDRQDLAGAVALQHPRAVLLNARPGDPPSAILDMVPVPVIECSLPSQSWLGAHPGVRACLTKPVTSDQLANELDKLAELHDILVVDDERGFCKLVQGMLAVSHPLVRVRLAHSGAESLRKMSAHPPDVLLLDLVMPDMNGFGVLDAMRKDQRLASIPVILLTATSYAEDAAMQTSRQIVLRRAGGLRPAEVLASLRALLDVVKPRYDERGGPSEAMVTAR